jgi:hypothetical protein
MKALIKTGDASNMPIPQYIVDTVEEMNAFQYLCKGKGNQNGI